MRTKPEKFVELNPIGVKRARLTRFCGGYSLQAYGQYSEMVATYICKQYGTVTVDDIRAMFDYHDIPILGNKWFTFFGDEKKWVEIGTIKSMRPVSKKRSILVWVRK